MTAAVIPVFPHVLISLKKKVSGDCPRALLCKALVLHRPLLPYPALACLYVNLMHESIFLSSILLEWIISAITQICKFTASNEVIQDYHSYLYERSGKLTGKAALYSIGSSYVWSLYRMIQSQMKFFRNHAAEIASEDSFWIGFWNWKILF